MGVIFYSIVCVWTLEVKQNGDLSQKFEAISPIEARILFEGHNLPDYWFPQIRFPISEPRPSAPIHQLRESQFN